jgi:phosphoribosylanthranilate isomerase
MQICGITSVEDCEVAAKCGADLIGMIMWPKAKRAVCDATAAKISAKAREHGALPVGVFVDEEAEAIVERCQRAHLAFAQLHGDTARQSIHQLPGSVRVIYVMHATPTGKLVTLLPSEQESVDKTMRRKVSSGIAPV